MVNIDDQLLLFKIFLNVYAVSMKILFGNINKILTSSYNQML